MAQGEGSIDISDNKQIISALKAGNERVFDAVYRYYFARLCAFCSQYIYEQEELEEIVQETMVWLWENKCTLMADLTLKSSLFTIVKNKALNRLTHLEIKQRVHKEIADKHEQEFENPDFYLGSEIFSLYAAALNQLPVEFRQAFEMNRNQQMTHKEIAQQLGVSPQTVNYRIGQALKLLRVALKDYLPLLVAVGLLPK